MNARNNVINFLLRNLEIKKYSNTILNFTQQSVNSTEDSRQSDTFLCRRNKYAFIQCLCSKVIDAL